MGKLPFRDEHLAEQVAAFADKITPAKERWLYCFGRASYATKYNGEECTLLNPRTFSVCGRIIGVAASSAGNKFRMIIHHGGYDAAEQWAADVLPKILQQKPYFWVGPMQAWHVGHIYFARVKSHPHVLKIGFSRRVRARLEDIESKNKTQLVTEVLKVGTLADEHWWHHNWRKTNISGEWFFDPFTSERTLPHFLAHVAEKKAA